MKTFADLKRELVIGKRVLLVSKFGKEINEEREVVKVQSNAWAFKTPTCEKSWLEFPKASLVSFEEDIFTIHAPGYRPLTDKEKEIKDGWQKIRNAMTDSSCSYFLEVGYYKKHNSLYLMGNQEEKGMKYDYETGMVRDKAIKGKASLVYRILK